MFTTGKLQHLWDSAKFLQQHTHHLQIKKKKKRRNIRLPTKSYHTAFGFVLIRAYLADNTN